MDDGGGLARPGGSARGGQPQLIRRGEKNHFGNSGKRIYICVEMC